MRILLIVQGEGRGHLTQAITMEEILRQRGHEVVEVLVGKSNTRRLPGFFNRNIQAPVKRFFSPNFLPTAANKRSNIFLSIAYNLLRLPVYVKSMHYIYRRICDTKVDIVINFYEVLTGLTYLFFHPDVPQISIGHQYLFLHHDFCFPRNKRFETVMLRFFTRLTCLGAKEKLALSFYPMPDDERSQIHVLPPLLRKEVLACDATVGEYLLGYLLNAGFAQNICTWHKRHANVPLHFFWDKQNESDEYQIDDTLTFHQISDTKFLHYMMGCRAYATTAGFESVCEAMYLGKPILMVPVHIEQDCNACDAVRIGAGIMSTEFDLEQLLTFSKTYQPNIEFRSWVRSCHWLILERIEWIAETIHCSMPLASYSAL